MLARTVGVVNAARTVWVERKEISVPQCLLRPYRLNGIGDGQELGCVDGETANGVNDALCLPDDQAATWELLDVLDGCFFVAAQQDSGCAIHGNGMSIYACWNREWNSPIIEIDLPQLCDKRWW